MKTQSVNMQELASLLEANFDSNASIELDARIEFQLGDESLLMIIRDKQLTLHAFDKSNQAPEIILFFESVQLAHEIFSGTKEWVDAFMNGKLRSNSNLIWVFQIVGALRES